jgi:small-conductance mechanosensitive channel
MFVSKKELTAAQAKIAELNAELATIRAEYKTKSAEDTETGTETETETETESGTNEVMEAIDLLKTSMEELDKRMSAIEAAMQDDTSDEPTSKAIAQAKAEILAGMGGAAIPTGGKNDLPKAGASMKRSEWNALPTAKERNEYITKGGTLTDD